MTKIEVEKILPIAINIPARGPARLELKRIKQDNNYFYIAQYRDNSGGCYYGTMKKSWDAVVDDMRDFLIKQKIINFK